MKYLNRLLAATLLVAVAAGATFATGQSETTGTDEKPQISVAIFDRGRVPPEKGTYEQNDVTEWINENAPVSVTFVPVPRWETQQKYNLWLAAGEAPDVFMEYQPEMTQNYVNQGVLMELSEYIDEYGPNIRAMTPPSLAQWGVYNGGEYAVPNFRPEAQVANWNVWIRTDWLDELGLEMPETVEEFYDVAVAFSEAQPDGESAFGYNLSSGGVDGLQAIANMYGTMPNTWIMMDGELEVTQVTENYRDAMALARRLYAAGAVDPEYFTDAGSNQAQQDFVTGRLGMFAENSVRNAYPTLMENIPDAELAPLPIPESPSGRFGWYQEREVSLINMVPATSKSPEGAIMYLDWMLAEGWPTVKYGFEGEHWEWRDGLRVSIADEETRNMDLVYRGDYPIMNNDPEDAETVRKRWAEAEPIQRDAWHLIADGIESTLAHPFERTLPTNSLGLELHTEIWTGLSDFALETWTQAVIGEITIDEAYELIRSEFDNQGYQDLKAQINEKARELGYIQ